jgi:hypothetical protein
MFSLMRENASQCQGGKTNSVHMSWIYLCVFHGRKYGRNYEKKTCFAKKCKRKELRRKEKHYYIIILFLFIFVFELFMQVQISSKTQIKNEIASYIRHCEVL